MQQSWLILAILFGLFDAHVISTFASDFELVVPLFVACSSKPDSAWQDAD
jgi:hypothetical protein